MIVNKPWGTTELIFSNSLTEIFRAKINKNGFSSRHYHKNKYNIFYIESGSLLIKSWQNENSFTETIFNKEEKTIIAPTIWHQFLAIEDSTILEIYFTEISNDDIIRYI